MKFELNEWHRNISNEELISDVINTAKKLGKNTLTRDEYSKNGKYDISTVSRRFGGWKNVLELCLLEIDEHNFIRLKKVEHNFKFKFVKDISEADVIAELNRVANIIEKDTVTRVEFEVHSKMCSTNLLYRKFGSWTQVLKLAGMENKNRRLSDEELYEEIERVWMLLGRQPTYTDMRNGISKYSPHTFENHFGSWRNALESFVKYINNENDESPELLEVTSIPNIPQIAKHLKNTQTSQEHTTNRNINLRLRFLVMKKDNFKCCMCGASPAKDPSVELHIDHIIPWSKGGETTIDNLQTLCSKCNLGKSNLT